MKKLILVLTLLMSGCAATDNAYMKVGTGYKFNEAEVRWDGGATNTPLSVRFELGSTYENFTYGYSHHSQVSSGFPFNNDKEYFKDEIFIDYTIKLGDLF